MSFLPRLLLCLTVLITPHMALAQGAVSFYDNYLALRARLDPLIMSRSIAQALPAFGDVSEAAELAALEGRVREIFPVDFENVALIRRVDLEHGFRQELIAYWTETSYIYVYLVLHQRDDGLLALAFTFNSDFDDLNGLF
ncbi:MULTISPECIES: hypothetical protein [unclassified Marinovum]